MKKLGRARARARALRDRSTVRIVIDSAAARAVSLADYRFIGETFFPLRRAPCRASILGGSPLVFVSTCKHFLPTPLTMTTRWSSWTPEKGGSCVLKQLPFLLYFPPIGPNYVCASEYGLAFFFLLITRTVNHHPRARTSASRLR